MAIESHELLEQRFSEFTGKPNMVACSSGTAALHLALEALEVKGEVIVPEFTMIACARACTLAGCTPRFVDCGPDLLMDPKLILQAITPQTEAIMAVHIYGRRCNMPAIHKIADRHSLLVIEDCAEYHGGDLSGVSSDAYCWSFYKNKIIAGEEGGAVSFNHFPKCAQTAKRLRSLGREGPLESIHTPRGHNYRLSDVHAQLILASLDKYPENVEQRWEVEEKLRRHFPSLPREAPWVHDIQSFGLNALSCVRTLLEHDIPARRAFAPISQQPEYLGHYRHLNAYARSLDTFYLPLIPEIGRRIPQILDILKK